MRLFKSLKNKAFNFFFHVIGFIHAFLLELIAIGFIGIGLCWLIAFFMNGLYGYKFDLSSCWQGVSALAGSGVLAAVKYLADSWKNSPEGEMPKQEKIDQKQGFAHHVSDLMEDYSDDGKLNHSNIKNKESKD